LHFFPKDIIFRKTDNYSLGTNIGIMKKNEIMLRNYITITLRNILRQKGYSLINILGLSIGLMACLFIVLFIIDELSFDKHHENGDNIYRFVVSYGESKENEMAIPIHSYRLREAVLTEFPEIEKVSRLTHPSPVRCEFDDKLIDISLAAVDQDFLDIFTVELIEGSKEGSLTGPGTILISETIARKLFGESTALDKTISIWSPFGKNPGIIKGVYKDFPKNSHFHLDAIISTKTTDLIFNERQLNSWGEGMNYVYCVINSEREAQSIISRFPDFVEKVRGEGTSEHIRYSLQRLHDIHLKSNLRYELEPNSDIRYVYIFGVVALFILLIAAFNYMNLSTARSIRRSKEVGIRKVTGASRRQLIIQFSSEAVVFTFLSMWLALLFSEIVLPYFNNLSGKELEIDVFNKLGLIASLVLVSVIVGIFAGIYPAFFLSRFKPINALYGKIGNKNASSFLRKVLVVVQFAISIFLIVSTIAIYSQWNYMRNARLGINPNNVLVVPSPGDDFRVFKEEILKDASVLSVSALNKKPTAQLSSNLSFTAEGMAEDEEQSIKIVTIDWDYFETIENKIIAGRSFEKQFPADERDGFILNKAAVDLIGWNPDEAIGKWFKTYTLDSSNVNFIERKGKVIGVAENFNFESLHNSIAPAAYFIQNTWINWMVIRINGQDTQKTISMIGNKWKQFNADNEFTYSFWDDDIENLYQSEKRFFKIFISFAGLAIFIACLGILGLISFTAEQRTKEIGIRKTMGASVSGIIGLLSYDFLKLVLMANLIAWPVAYYFMKQWLLDFPVKIKLGIWIFALSAIAAILIALLTTIYQAYRAATANPARALKYE
jgi:putative ABC transport system permease protein